MVNQPHLPVGIDEDVLLRAVVVADEGIMGAITGRAIYEGTINLKDAIDWLNDQ